MPAKQIQKTSWLTEKEFTGNDGLRNELFAAINSQAFRQAVHILTKRRQFAEAAVEASGLPAPEITSVRMHSQRVGMEGFLNDLEDLCKTPVQPPDNSPPDFGAGEPPQES